MHDKYRLSPKGREGGTGRFFFLKPSPHPQRGGDAKKLCGKWQNYTYCYSTKDIPVSSVPRKRVYIYCREESFGSSTNDILVGSSGGGREQEERDS